jgi:hypothetical protein
MTSLLLYIFRLYYRVAQTTTSSTRVDIMYLLARRLVLVTHPVSFISTASRCDQYLGGIL